MKTGGSMDVKFYVLSGHHNFEQFAKFLRLKSNCGNQNLNKS